MNNTVVNQKFIDALDATKLTAPEELVNKPESKQILRGCVYFGETILLGYNVERISIVQTYKGLQELHLHEFTKTEDWKDEMFELYYREGLPGGKYDPVERPDLFKKETVLLNVTRLQIGKYDKKLNGYDWADSPKKLKFTGRVTQSAGNHLVFKPYSFNDVMSDVTRAKLSEQSILRKILPPKPLS